MTLKDDVHHLVDELDEQDLADAQRILEDIRAHGQDSLARRLLTAPIDDEPETDEERRLVEEARQGLAAGHVVSHEEIRREFGVE